MQLLTSSLLLLLLLLTATWRVQGSGKDGHYADDDDSDDDAHNTKFDQEQFLGKERAKEFSELEAKESIERLKKLIADEVDTDKDGFVTAEELANHLEKTHKQQEAKDLEANWKDLNLSSDQLDWATYAKSLHPGLFDDTAPKPVSELAAKAIDIAAGDPASIDLSIPADVSSDDRTQLEEFFKDLLRHRKRWRVADTNSDGSISKQEYVQLLFPEESPQMLETLIAETMETVDKNKDGIISREEFIADLWKPKTEGQKQPGWVDEEVKDFDTKKDLNRDGQLDASEVQQWVKGSGGSGQGMAQSEASHLMNEADGDKDGKLSLDEIVTHHDLFAGSQATNFGEDLDGGEGHDEL